VVSERATVSASAVIASACWCCLADRDGDRGIGEYRTLISSFFAAFPDSTFTLVNVAAEGDRLYLHFEITGTHRGEFSGFPATGRFVRFPEMRVRRIQNGKFAEHWGSSTRASCSGNSSKTITGAARRQAAPGESRTIRTTTHQAIPRATR
jgi:predicted ester cyclase